MQGHAVASESLCFPVFDMTNGSGSGRHLCVQDQVLVEGGHVPSEAPAPLKPERLQSCGRRGPSALVPVEQLEEGCSAAQAHIAGKLSKIGLSLHGPAEGPVYGAGIEGLRPGQHEEENGSAGEHINLGAAGLPDDHLRCGEPWRTASVMSLLHIRGVATDAEVREDGSPIAGQEDVLWLDIPVYDAPLVNMLQGRQDPPMRLSGTHLREHRLGYGVEEVTAWAELHRQGHERLGHGGLCCCPITGEICDGLVAHGADQPQHVIVALSCG
mmetsp:Transcript_80853/g.182419  ORF Transcript_80853/g.182419 Transcript_80853/m.182419 type:complete len:270 (-) Transcript_80853:526-1335(-)